MKSKTTTTVEFPVDEFNKLINEHFPQFKGKSIKIEYLICEVGGDPMDRFPGRDEVTRISVTHDGCSTSNQLSYMEKSSLAKQIESVEKHGGGPYS